MAGLTRSCLGTSESYTRAWVDGAFIGVWQRVFEVLAQEADNEYAMIDSTIVRAQQHSAGVKGGMQTAKQLDLAHVG